MTGICGSGKTTFAKQLAKKLDLLYLCPDDFYAIVNGDSTEKGHQNEFDIWMMFWRAIHLAEMNHKSVIIDTNSPTFCKREQFLDWFNFDNYFLIYIEADATLCLENNSNRKRTIPYDSMQEIISSYEVPDLNKEKRWNTIYHYINKNNMISFKLEGNNAI